MPRPRPERPPRPRRTWSATEALVNARALRVLVGDSDEFGLGIADLRRRLLVETRRPAQRYAGHARILTDNLETWTVEVIFDATGPGRWTASFAHLPPTPATRNRQVILDLGGAVDTEGTGSDAALRLRLCPLARPWHKEDLVHVTNVVHAELHGCAAIDVDSHSDPTGQMYYEIEAAISAAGQLVRHGAALNGFDLDFDPDRRIALDAGWDV